MRPMSEKALCAWVRALDGENVLNVELHLNTAHWFVGQGDTTRSADRAINREAARLADELMADVPWFQGFPEDARFTPRSWGRR